MKKVITALVLLFVLSVNVFAQTPAYYNYSTGSNANSFPLNQAAGKCVQWLFLAGEYNTPSVAPSGNMTSMYFRIATGYPLTATTYTNLKLILGQSTITSLTSGAFYTGTMDTVYTRASVTLTAAADTWLQLTFDHPFAYDNTKSLIVQLEQCSASGATATFSLAHTNLTGNRRVWSSAGCPFAPYAGVGANVVNCGFDISTASNTFYSSQWCSGSAFANLPAAQYFNAAAWLGDTLYVQAPASGAGANTIYRYTYGGTWSTGVPLPTTRIGGTLTACGSKLYYIGGGASSITSPDNLVYMYDPATGAWTAKATLPVALSSHGAVNWGDSVIFVISGNYSTPSTSCYAYRVGSDTWITTTSAPFARRTFAYGISGNKIFMGCGYNGGYMKDFAYGVIGSNASTITWTTGPQVPVGYAGISRPGGTAYGDRFFIVGGERSGLLQSDSSWIYNTATNTWTGLAGKPTAVSNICASVTSKKIHDTVKVFCAGGYLASAAGTANLDVIGCGPSLTWATINTSVPNTFALNQNYPNPFNPTTKISYAIPKAGLVSIKIYDVVGKEVATLVNETKNAGSYIVDFDGSSFASGTYFYRLESNGFISTKKMILIK